MLRSLSVAVAILVALPEAASMQVPPAAPPGPGSPMLPAVMVFDASQEPPRPATPRPVPPPAAPVETQVTPAGPPRTLQPPSGNAPAPPAPPRKARGRDLNVQIEITISDQVGNAAPDKRVVSMLIADASFGRIRSIADNGIAALKIDARPEILENDRIVVELTIEYRPVPPDGAGASRRPAPLNEQLTVIFQNGKPLLISQAADPLADRKMTVEVRASVMK